MKYIRPAILSMLIALAYLSVASATPGPQATITQSMKGSSTVEHAIHLIEDGHIIEGRKLLLPFCHRPDSTARMYLGLAESYIEDPEMDPKMNNEIVNDLNLAIKLDPDNGEHYRYMARFYNVQGRWKEALVYEEKALSAKRPDFNALKERSGTYSSLARYNEALADLNSFIAHKGSSDRVYFVKGTILEELKRYDEAAQAYRQSIGLRNQDRTIIQLSRCLALAGRTREAIDELNKVIKTTPLDDESLVMRGRLYRKDKNLQLALNDFTKALEIEPTAKIYTERASLYAQLGMKAAEAKDLARAREMDSRPF